MKKHYGLPNLRTACGLYVADATTRRSTVTCQLCKGTLKYATAWFSQVTAIGEPRIKRTTKRNGARP